MNEQQSNGVVIGIVSDLDDDLGLGRVKVKYPHLGYKESDWIRMATLMAGPKRGAFFRPEKDDEVLVCFRHNEPRDAYIIGALWSQTDQPPPDDGQRTQNNWRFIQSRCGHIILLDDTPGKEKIELIDKDGERRIVIDSANRKIQVICKSGDVEVQAATGDVLVEANKVTIKANEDLTLTANGTVTIQGQTVNIN